MTDYTKMSTQELETLCSQLQQEEFQMMKELLRRNIPINKDSGEIAELVSADMRPTEEDF